MWHKIIFFILSMVFIGGSHLYGQSIRVQGTLTDEDGISLIGANIVIKDTNKLTLMGNTVLMLKKRTFLYFHI